MLKKYPSLLTIVMSGESTMYTTVEAMKSGGFRLPDQAFQY
ncbi:MAG: hypothetical protein CM1200mP28_05070 [Deltaproteobacteria bacterium]|nr:MAG: hypothetical protein CM1200mP28_05070 [Deltaproteobacteria bacterium]